MFDHAPQDRRRFLRQAANLSIGMLLTGCGGGGGSPVGGAVAVTTVPSAVISATVPVAAVSAHPLGLALNLAYLGAQYYGFAARGSGLSAAMTSGVGIAGSVIGPRQATFADPLVFALATELAEDKQTHVATLRERIGAQVPAQPPLDLSAGPRGAFSTLAQSAGILPPGAAFDPYTDDGNFLIGAFVIENAVAAAYRTALAQTSDPAMAMLLAEAIYHGGAVRTALDARASSNAAIDTALTNASRQLSTLDGTNVGDQSLTGAVGTSSNLVDAEGRPIPFTRANAQVLKVLYLSSNGVGGFLPSGANGVAD